MPNYTVPKLFLGFINSANKKFFAKMSYDMVGGIKIYNSIDETSEEMFGPKTTVKHSIELGFIEYAGNYEGSPLYHNLSIKVAYDNDGDITEYCSEMSLKSFLEQMKAYAEHHKVGQDDIRQVLKEMKAAKTSKECEFLDVKLNHNMVIVCLKVFEYMSTKASGMTQILNGFSTAKPVGKSNQIKLGNAGYYLKQRSSKGLWEIKKKGKENPYMIRLITDSYGRVTISFPKKAIYDIEKNEIERLYGKTNSGEYEEIISSAGCWLYQYLSDNSDYDMTQKVISIVSEQNVPPREFFIPSLDDEFRAPAQLVYALIIALEEHWCKIYTKAAA